MTALSSPVAFAADEDEEEEENTVTVTGSRIKRSEAEGANPVQTFTREDIVLTGINNVGDMLQEIPSVAGAGTNQSINNGGSGAIRVSLRGLGSERTLVLLNGRRVVASGTGANASVDLSTIPTSIIERVEVLKDGASAIYGSDAIGGVVNIITRQDFEGAEFNVSRDQSTYSGDGASTDYDFTAGISSSRGSAVVSAYYSKQEPQWSGDREWSRYENDLDPDEMTISQGGSSAPPWGRYNGVNSFNEDNFIQDTDDDGSLLFDDEGEPIMVLPDGTCDSFTHGAGSGPGQSDPTDFSNPTGYDCWDWDKDTYNYAPANYHLLPVERYGFFSQGNYEINDMFNFFTEISYSHREASTKLAPEPLAPLVFFGYSGATYSADNYYNQQFGPTDMNGDTVDIADWRRRVVETGGRSDNYSLNTTRFVLGFDGEISLDWSYEFSYIYGRNETSNRTGGNFNLDKVALAVGPSFMDAEGNIVCGADSDSIIDGCVPLNTFGIPGSDTQISQDMLDYVTFEGHDVGVNEQQIIAYNVFGSAFELPAGPVGVAAGIEHREEKGADYPDALVALGITTGGSRLPTEGSYSIDEVYLETNLPLLDNLELDLAVRYSDYDTFGSTSNYKAGVKFRPIDDLMLRGTISTAFRAPSTADLFGGAGITYPTVSDPCATNATTTCIADGVPTGGYEALGDQLRQTYGGSVDVEPEEADIFTVGLVYNPQFLDGLSLTFDYWDIELTNAISTIGPDVILQGCAATGDYCDLIDRWPDDNVLLIDDRTSNVGGVDSSGFDFNVRYHTETDFGMVNVNLDTTFNKTYDKTLADGTVQQHAGWYVKDGDGNFPEWKTNLSVGLTKDDWAASWSMRYIDEVQENWTVWWSNTVGERTIDSQVIHNARFSYFMENITVSFGVNNLLDEDPPFAASGFNDNTDPRTYDTNGRHIYVSVGLQF